MLIRCPFQYSIAKGMPAFSPARQNHFFHASNSTLKWSMQWDCDKIMFWNEYTLSLLRSKDPLDTFNHFITGNYLNVAKKINKITSLKFDFLTGIVFCFLNSQVHPAVSYYKNNHPSLLFNKQFLRLILSPAWEHEHISPDEFCVLYNRKVFLQMYSTPKVILFGLLDSPVEVHHCFLKH